MAYAEQADAAVRPVSLQTVIDDFGPALERLEKVAGRAAQCADRIVGVRPSAVENEKDNPSPGHLLLAIQSRRDRMLRFIDRLEDELNRIENGIN